MEQNITYQVCLILLRQKLHARAIAKILQINHTAILRTLKELTQKNVVDFTESGRNKTYHIKNTLEARNFVIASEIFRSRELLAKYPSLRKIIGSIQQNTKIKMATIFGSYAKGTAKQDSDIDIYIETKNNLLKKEVEAVDSKASVKIGLFDENSPLGKEIIENHVIIKGVEQFYESKSIFKEII